jgi:hypothetical protein
MVDNEIKHSAETTDTKEESKSKKSSRSNPLISIINGDFLSKEFVLNNLSFIFYVIFLLLMLVSKGYYDKQLTKELDNTQKELNEIMGDFVAAKAQMEEETRRVRLVEELAPLGLKETVNPTKVIRIRKD